MDRCCKWRGSALSTDPGVLRWEYDWEVDDGTLSSMLLSERSVILVAITFQRFSHLWTCARASAPMPHEGCRRCVPATERRIGRGKETIKYSAQQRQHSGIRRILFARCLPMVWHAVSHSLPHRPAPVPAAGDHALRWRTARTTSDHPTRTRHPPPTPHPPRCFNGVTFAASSGVACQPPLARLRGSQGQLA